jgi:hypothetical protein
MWCSSCQAEVAAKVSTDNNRLFCASCGKELNIAVANSGQEKTREAQDLLKRWSNQSNQEELVTTASTASGSSESESISAVENAKASCSLPENSERDHSSSDHENKFIENRISEAVYPSMSDSKSNETGQQDHNIPEDRQPETIPFPVPSQSHNPNLSSSVDIQSTITRDKPQNTNWVGFFGQILAYGGVGILTVGTCMVLMGYFGGKEGYAPQGWLITTVGQMALLLGIVTLVSCGIESSSSEVTNHIASLDERILRIEQAALANFSNHEKTTQSEQSSGSSYQANVKAS